MGRLENAALSLEMELRESAPEAAEGLLRFVRHLESAEKAPTDSLETWTAQFEEALGKVEKSLSAVNETVERHVQEAENAQNQGKMELQRYSDQHANLGKEKSGIETELLKIKQTRLQLSADSERLSQMKAAVEGLKTKLEKYEGVDAQMQDARSALDETNGGYQLYLQNETAAKGIGEVRNKLAQARRSQEEAENELADAETALANLQKDFDPEKLTALRGRIETLNAAITEISAEISAGDENLKNERKNLEDMEEALREIEKIDKEIDRNGRAEKLAAFVRSRMLNVVGERISYLYRQEVNARGSDLYRQLSGDPQAQLEWSEDYELNLKGASDRSLNSSPAASR